MAHKGSLNFPACGLASGASRASPYSVFPLEKHYMEQVLLRKTCITLYYIS